MLAYKLLKFKKNNRHENENYKREKAKQHKEF